jgi:hypothetical protein
MMQLRGSGHLVRSCRTSLPTQHDTRFLPGRCSSIVESRVKGLSLGDRYRRLDVEEALDRRVDV